MERECEGGGREVQEGPPPDVAMTCPVCGRETKVDVDDADGGMRLTIARHQQVGTA
ncbi:MAG: hypothetical protein QOD90_192 [Mycobacterium sp.]|jgi:hypothetical protein|nr:hypothetical protein [Mycobacterium sp.]